MPGDGIFGKLGILTAIQQMRISQTFYEGCHPFKYLLFKNILDLPSLSYISVYIRVCQFIHKVKTERKQAQQEEGLRNTSGSLWGQHGKDQSLSAARKHVVIDTCRFDQLLSAGTRGEPSEKAQKKNSILEEDRIRNKEEAHKAHKAKPPQFQMWNQSSKGHADPWKHKP